MTSPSEPTTGLAQVFLSSANFRHRGEPLSLPPNTPLKPQSISVELKVIQLDDGSAAAVSLTVRSDPADERALYDFDVTLLALFQSPVAPTNMLELGTGLLYPFARETVANLTMRGRFGPVWLNPFNVKMALQEQAAREAAKASST